MGKLPECERGWCNEQGGHLRRQVGPWQNRTASEEERLQALGLLLRDLRAVGLRSSLVTPSKGGAVLFIHTHPGRSVAILAVHVDGQWWFMCRGLRVAARQSAEFARELARMLGGMRL